MIQKYVDRFMEHRDKLFVTEHAENYYDIVEAVINTISRDRYDPDPKRIHVIDDGDCQGMLLYIIADGSYQPFEYWFVEVFYGSCSDCDTLEHIRTMGNYSCEEPPTEQQTKDYQTLALHVIQRLKKLGGDT